MGLGFFVEKSGLGPFDDVRITLGCNGTIELITGAASICQGVETVLAQICADGLGTGLDHIRVIHGQTDRIARGMGAFASRVTVMTGAAVTIAAAKLRGELLRVAGQLLQTAPEHLAITGDRVGVCGAPGGPSLDLGAIARSAGGELTAGRHLYCRAHDLPLRRASRAGAHPARQLRGGGRAVLRWLRRRASRQPDAGRGADRGGAAQGIGASLLEEFVYDASGQPQSVTLADYPMPSIAEIPPIEVVLFEDAPTPLNPLGVKGAGEARIAAGGRRDRRRGR